MGAYAHLVAFDEQRSGFAHLHPQTDELNTPPDAVKPELKFKVLIPKSGRYVIWAQVKIAGDEEFIPFWVDVLPGGRDDTPEITPEKPNEPEEPGKKKGDRGLNIG
jgi:hypothetical protein